MISLILLTYNRENYVARAIDSILNQTYSDFELLIIDNNSSDNTPQILHDYRERDSRIRLFRRSDSGIGAGRNLGLANANGEYFTFFDDDDYCAPDYLAFLHELAETHQSDIAVCGSWYDMNGTIKPKYVFDDLVLCNREQAVSNFLLRRYFNSGNPTKLFRNTPKMKEIRYSEAGKYDDIHTMYRFFTAVGTQEAAVAAKGEPKYFVNRHTTNNSSAVLDHSKLTPEWLDEYLTAYKTRTIYISQRIPPLAELALWSEWSYMISMVEKINRFSISTCDRQLEYMLKQLQNNRTRFLEASWTRDFEREWMEEYIR